MTVSDRTILLIDRVQDSVSSYQRLLQQDGHRSSRVLAACYDDSTIALCQSQPLDAIVLVSHGSDGNGFEVLTQLRAQRDRRPPIIVLGDNDANLARRAFKAGATDYLIRDDVTAELLHQALRTAASDGLNSAYSSLQQQLRATEAALDDSRDELGRQSHIFEAVLSTISDFVYLFDREGRFVFVNQPLLDLWGLTLADAIGKNFQDLNYPEHLATQLQQQIEQVFTTAQSIRDETPYTSPTGQGGMYEYIFKPLLGADGSVQFVAGSTRDVTTYKRIEATLRESETKYRTLFNSIDEAFCILELIYDDGHVVDWRYLDANPAFKSHTGWPNPIGKRVRELEPNLESLWFKRFEQLIVTGEALRFIEYSAVMDKWFDVSAFLVGEPHEHKVTLLFEDVTERKRAEAIFQRNAELNTFRIALTDALRSLVDPVDVQATASQVLGEFLNANRVAYFEVHGDDYVIEQDYTNGAASIVGRYSINAFGPEIFATYRRGHTAIATNVATVPHLTPEQRSVYAAIQAVAYIGVPLVKQGEFVAGLAVHMAVPRDWMPEEIALAEEVAERTWATVERARAEATMAADLDDMRLLRDLGAQLISEDSIQVLYDKTVAAAIALTRADAGTLQVLEESTQELVLLAQQGFSQTMMDRFSRVRAGSNTSCGLALRSGERMFVDFAVPASEDPAGTLRMHVEDGYLSGQSTPLISRSGRLIGMVSTHWRRQHRLSHRELRFLDLLTRQVSDLIEQRQADAERSQLLEREQNARAEAERANRIKDEFLAILSHELRSPLNPILGWSKLLQTRTLDAAKTQRALETIERNAKLQTQLIDDLLDVARILRGKLKLEESTIDLSLVIEAALEVVKTAAAAKSIALHPELADRCQVRGDSGRLQQIVWNLLSNAIKFTPSGGHVDIRLRAVEDHAQIAITDSGKGIQPEFLPHLFQAFRQEDASITRQHGGLGLGLAIVKHLVDAHGGTIAADSPGEGQGATFTVQLPLAKQAKQASVVSPFSLAERDLTGIKVLAVDDNEDTRELLIVLLRQYGAETKVVSSGDQVLVSLSDFRPHVLVCDIGMPDMDGYSLLQRVRDLPADQGGDIPAIAVTAFTREDDRQRALSVGFQKHLAKPIVPEKLAVAIAELIPNPK